MKAVIGDEVKETRELHIRALEKRLKEKVYNSGCAMVAHVDAKHVDANQILEVQAPDPVGDDDMHDVGFSAHAPDLNWLVGVFDGVAIVAWLNNPGQGSGHLYSGLGLLCCKH